MKSWLRGIGAVAVAATLAGCKTDPNIILMERELREQENAIYDLQWCVQDYQRALETAQHENESLRNQVAGDKPGAKNGGSKSPSVPGEIKIEMGEESGSATPKKPAEKPSNRPDPNSPAPKFKPPVESAPNRPATPAAQQTAVTTNRPMQWGPRSPSTDSASVRAIGLNRDLTAAYREPNSQIDDGITLCIEPRDDQNRLVEVAAPVAVALLDRKGEGESARLGLWEFTAEEVGPMIGKSPQGHGIYTRLPWPSKPAHEQLEICVRYTTRDGRKLESRQPLDVQLSPAAPGPAKAETVPTPAPRETEPVQRSDTDQPGNDPPRAAAKPSRSRDSTAKRPVWSPYR